MSILYPQYGWTAVLLSAAGGHLDLMRELVEQHRADLYHKAKASSATLLSVIHIVTSVMCPCILCGSHHTIIVHTYT